MFAEQASTITMKWYKKETQSFQHQSDKLVFKAIGNGRLWKKISHV